ncbi:MAG: triose-phosphate isomerase [Candidatus Komeilibacteria bacterium]|nr:triose-phosphate isomerase [Candidatus Komeilibacteria bacterium]
MKKTIIIANWKMNLSPDQAEQVLGEMLALSPSWPLSETSVVVCPSFEALSALAPQFKNSALALGAQNCFWEDEGAYTGEISPKFLKGLGCQYVIVGHSERRQNLGETDAQVSLKVKAALRNGLVPIICVGETFQERQDGQKDAAVSGQVNRALEGLKLLSGDELVLAYEPVWVIGSGQAVSPEEAGHTSQVIRQVLLDHFSLEQINSQTRIIYGGSVNPLNVKNFVAWPTIDGILVGGASLAAKTFSELVTAGSVN